MRGWWMARAGYLDRCTSGRMRGWLVHTRPVSGEELRVTHPEVHRWTSFYV